jgi:predicted ATPase
MVSLLHLGRHSGVRPNTARELADVPLVIEGEEIPSIYIVGAQSTGKTTLVNAIRDHFASLLNAKHSRPEFIEERARIVFKQQSFTADDVTKHHDRYMRVQRLILQAQYRAERRALENREWFVSDRSGADALFYASRHIGLVALSILCRSLEWAELRERLSRSLIVVCEAGSDWLVDDGSGIRIMPGDREEWVDIHTEFCELLDSLDLKYEVLPCGVTSLRERVDFVLEKHIDFMKDIGDTSRG